MKTKFKETLSKELAARWHEPQYSRASQQTTPEEWADRLTEGLAKNLASKDGEAVKATLKTLGIKNTYKAIVEYLSA